MADLDLERYEKELKAFGTDVLALTSEIRRLREERDEHARKWHKACDEAEALATERERYRFALQFISAVRRGVEVTDTLEERLDYWSALALAYRRAAEEALNPPEVT